MGTSILAKIEVMMGKEKKVILIIIFVLLIILSNIILFSIKSDQSNEHAIHAIVDLEICVGDRNGNSNQKQICGNQLPSDTKVISLCGKISAFSEKVYPTIILEKEDRVYALYYDQLIIENDDSFCQMIPLGQGNTSGKYQITIYMFRNKIATIHFTIE